MTFFDADYPRWPDAATAREWLRPWKLATFAIAMSWLLYGATHYEIADWDVGVTVVMGTLTYTTAPWAVRMLGGALRYRPKYWWLHVAIALATAVFVVDTVYMTYHWAAVNTTYREENFRASLPIYLMAGLTWLYRGTLRQLLAEAGQAWRERAAGNGIDGDR
jgi:hypothetical protein